MNTTIIELIEPIDGMISTLISLDIMIENIEYYEYDSWKNLIWGLIEEYGDYL